MLLPVVDWKKVLVRSRLRYAAAGLAVLLCSGAGVAGYQYWVENRPKPPPPVESSTIFQDAEYAASDDFSRLPMQQRLTWIDSEIAKTNSMTEEEFFQAAKRFNNATRDQLRNNVNTVLRERLRRQVLTYDKLPAKEKDKYLDERLDEIKQMERRFNMLVGRGAARAPVGSGVSHASSGGTGLSDRDFQTRERKAVREQFRKQMNQFMVEENPDVRAKTVRYATDMGKRQIVRDLKRMFGYGPKK